MTALYRRVLLAATAAFALLPWTTASAQNNEGSQQDDRPPQARQQQQMKQRLAVLAQRLNLTDEQKQQWQQINQDTNQKVRAARKDDSLNEAQMQAQLRQIHKQHNQRLLAMLSPEQQQALKDFWQEQKQKQQQDKTSDNSSSGSGPSTQNSDPSKDKDDDLFAGMVSDDPTPPQPPQNKKTGPK